MNERGKEEGVEDRKTEKKAKKKKQQFPANIGSIATWQLSPPVCEKLSSGREPRRAYLSCGRVLGNGEQKRMG